MRETLFLSLRQGSTDSGRSARYITQTLVILALLLLVIAQCCAAELAIDVFDQKGQSLPCRVLVRCSGGACQTPRNALLLEIGPDRWFYTEGRFQLKVPTDEVEVRVEHGLEYKRFRRTIDVPDEGAHESIKLERWIDMKRQGYLCADNHLHIDSRSVGSMAIAEGLNFASSLTWWDGPDLERPVPAGQGATRQLEFGGQKIIASVHDAELEEDWGAVYVQNMQGPWPLKSDKRRPNLDYLKYAIAQGAIVHYQGGWSREVGLDALLGYVHTVNVCNNNFHMHRFQPRRRYSNLLEVEGFPDYPNTETGMMQMNTDTYYRLLNWGLRLAAGAGSATGVKQVPAGYNRAYVRVNPSSTLDEFNDAWKAGRNFVTNGPIIQLIGPRGELPGDDVCLEKPSEELAFRVLVFSDQPLKTIELVQDGTTVGKVIVADELQIEHTFHVPVRRSGWIAAKATSYDDLLSDQELQQFDNAPHQRPSRLRFCHTSPIYLFVEGKPAGVLKSMEEGRLMLDRLKVFASNQVAADRLEGVNEEIDRASAILQERISAFSGNDVEP